MNLRNTLTRGFLALAGSLCIATHAFAAAPMQWTEAPGFYRIALGQFEVTALSDGTISLPLDRLLANITADRAREALASRFQSASSETSVNAFLVNTGERLVLIDAGDPAGLRPGLGKLVANLRAAGYEPEQVDDVLITHMHRDHVGGLSTGGKATFPNATIHLAAHEAAYWLDDNNKAAAPEKNFRSFFDVASEAVRPYAASKKLKTFDGDVEILRGISARVAPGHTPGHSTFLVKSGEHRLVLWGDLVHVEAIQFYRPEATLRFDVSPSEAVAQRYRAYEEAERGGYLIGASHMSFPGLGRLHFDGTAYQWVPVQYSVPQPSKRTKD